MMMITYNEPDEWADDETTYVDGVDEIPVEKKVEYNDNEYDY
jgi:hypothetical protein